MTFDPTTAYLGDYQWQNFVEDTTWEVPGDPTPARMNGLKGRWGDFTTPDFRSLAAGLAFSTTAAAVVVWQPTPSDETEPPFTFTPKSGHILRRESKGSEGWLILDATQSQFGPWLCACEKEVVNG